MLFNSYGFLFLFLPVTLLGYRLVCTYKIEYRLTWLLISSMVFYAAWNAQLLPILFISVLVNYSFGRWISYSQYRKILFTIGLIMNLGVIGYFKYYNFLIDNTNTILGYGAFKLLDNLILPLGISFWTFQQVTYLVDIYKNKIKPEKSFLVYATYIFFFPQLIAGPIVRYEELASQLCKISLTRLSYRNLIIGLCFFSIGLFKKVGVADQLSIYVIDVFDKNHTTYTMGQAWLGALAYTLQLYFDFSGYSDMAIGLARMFNYKLPVNFHSPYKAKSIIDFWRRWHMTLSRFLRDYLYIPLGGKNKRYINLMLTMLIGGLWHGAGWTFVLWGGYSRCAFINKSLLA